MQRPPSLRSPWRTPRPAPWLNALRRWWYHHSPPPRYLDRVEAAVDWNQLVPEAGADFRHYLEGTSQVQVTSLDDVCRWLLACRYISDRRLVNRDDHWQHPLDFEQRRRGDCEDHALWGWRKLTDLGLAVEFVVGLWNPGPEDRLVNHAWLHVEDGGRLLLIETTATGRAAMALALEPPQPHYLPTASIDHQLRTYYFANYYHVQLYGRPMTVRAAGPPPP